jgi:hypothetical protein
MEHGSGMRSCRSEGTLDNRQYMCPPSPIRKMPGANLETARHRRSSCFPQSLQANTWYDLALRQDDFSLNTFQFFFSHNLIIQRCVVWDNENVVRWTWLRKQRRYINKQFDRKQIRLGRLWWRLYCCNLMCIFCTSYEYLLYYVCIAVLTLDAGLLARNQYPEGPATGHLDTGFS